MPPHNLLLRDPDTGASLAVTWDPAAGSLAGPGADRIRSVLWDAQQALVVSCGGFFAVIRDPFHVPRDFARALYCRGFALPPDLLALVSPGSD